MSLQQAFRGVVNPPGIVPHSVHNKSCGGLQSTGTSAPGWLGACFLWDTHGDDLAACPARVQGGQDAAVPALCEAHAAQQHQPHRGR